MQPANMAYDRAITVFSPDGRLFQVEYAREAVKRGTTTVGLKYKTGAVLLVDKRVTSRLIEPNSIEKIFEIDYDKQYLFSQSEKLNMEIPLSKFSQLVDRTILDRGRSYFKNGHVTSFEELSPGETWAWEHNGAIVRRKRRVSKGKSRLRRDLNPWRQSGCFQRLAGRSIFLCSFRWFCRQDARQHVAVVPTLTLCVKLPCLSSGIRVKTSPAGQTSG